MPRRFARDLARAACLGLLLTGQPLGAEPAAPGAVTMSLDEARDLAMRALAAGQPGVAQAIARALIEQNPKDYQAYLILAAAETRLGNGAAGAAAARSALALAETDEEKLFATREVASGLAEDGHWLRSQFWLRRAANSAKTPEQVALIGRDYAFVRRQNPWRGEMSFRVGPNPNITNASSAEVIWIYTPLGLLPMVPTVLSGVTAEASAGISYRIDHDNGAASVIGLSGYSRVNHLDAASAALLMPGASERDYDFQQAALSLRHVVPTRSGDVLDLGASLGRAWYGWAPYADFATLSGEWRRAPRDGLELALFANARGQMFSAPGADPVYSAEIGARFGHGLADGGHIGLRVAAEGAISASAASEYRGLSAKLDYDLGRPVLGADLSFSAGLGLRDYAYSPWSSTGRRDVILSAGVEAAFPSAAVMGFVPVISAGVDRDMSSLVIYDSQSWRLGFGLRSQF